MINKNYSLIINSNAVVIHKDVKEYCKIAKLPFKAFLLGSADEYELVFGILTNEQKAFEKQCAAYEIAKIGSFKVSDSPSLYWQSGDNIKADVEILLDPPLTDNKELYVKNIIGTAKRMFE